MQVPIHFQPWGTAGVPRTGTPDIKIGLYFYYNPIFIEHTILKEVNIDLVYFTSKFAIMNPEIPIGYEKRKLYICCTIEYDKSHTKLGQYDSIVKQYFEQLRIHVRASEKEFGLDLSELLMILDEKEPVVLNWKMPA